MRWAVIGSTGLLGRELLAFLIEKGENSQGFHRGNLNLSEDPNQIATQLNGYDIWVNCLGYTQVDRAESEITEANLTNGILAGALAQAAASLGARFIQISTDYVFDGVSQVPYGVTAVVDPKTAYGKSKALGERLVAESGADYSILRTAWLYGAHGACFPKSVVETLRTKGTARIVRDQIGQPTWTRDLAEKVFEISKLDEIPRIFHAVSSGKATWAEFAKAIAASLGMTEEAIEEISSAEYPTAAKRPAWSVLDNSSDVLTPIGFWRDRWQVAAAKVLRGI